MLCYYVMYLASPITKVTFHYFILIGLTRKAPITTDVVHFVVFCNVLKAYLTNSVDQAPTATI